MNRKYFDRKTKEHYKKLTRLDDDEARFVTESGPKIVEFAEAVSASRSLYLKDLEDKSMDVDDVLTMKIMELVNAAKETREYIEHANDCLAEQERRIKELKKGHRVFENQVRSLERKQED